VEGNAAASGITLSGDVLARIDHALGEVPRGRENYTWGDAAADGKIGAAGRGPLPRPLPQNCLGEGRIRVDAGVIARAGKWG
jgi:hypothetical protein